MQTYHQTGDIAASALKSGMDRKTARRYIRQGHDPGENRRYYHRRVGQQRPDQAVARSVNGAPFEPLHGGTISEGPLIDGQRIVTISEQLGETRFYYITVFPTL